MLGNSDDVTLPVAESFCVELSCNGIVGTTNLFLMAVAFTVVVPVCYLPGQGLEEVGDVLPPMEEDLRWMLGRGRWILWHLLTLCHDKILIVQMPGQRTTTESDRAFSSILSYMLGLTPESHSTRLGQALPNSSEQAGT